MGLGMSPHLGTAVPAVVPMGQAWLRPWVPPHNAALGPWVPLLFPLSSGLCALLQLMQVLAALCNSAAAGGAGVSGCGGPLSIRTPVSIRTPTWAHSHPHLPGMHYLFPWCSG